MPTYIETVETVTYGWNKIIKNMNFIEKVNHLHTIMYNHTKLEGKQSSNYLQLLLIIHEKLDVLVHEFTFIPFTHDVQKTYVVCTGCMCGILQMIEDFKHKQRKSEYIDFLITISEEITDMCIEFLSSNSSIQIK